jgi:Protein of unknown function (DUF1559)
MSDASTSSEQVVGTNEPSGGSLTLLPAVRAARPIRGWLPAWRYVLVGTAAALSGLFLVLGFTAKVRDAAARISQGNNLKNIALSAHDYHDTYLAFPPPFRRDKAGRPQTSWRLLLLPYLE